MAKEEFVNKKELKKIKEELKKAKKESKPFKIISKAILKKQPRATYTIPQDPEYQRSSYFNQEYEKERNLLGWK